MQLAERLSEYIRACFTGLWIESQEQEDALSEIALLCRQEAWQMAVWDIDQGLRAAGQEGDSPSKTNSDTEDAASGDPLAAVRAAGSLAIPGGTGVLVLVNFHRFLQSAEIVQALTHQIIRGKQNRTFVIILSPVVAIPTELEKLFVVLSHELPDRKQLEAIARGIASEERELPEGDGLATVLDAAAGLSRYEAEGAFSLSLVRDGAIRPESIWELKSQMLKKNGLVSLHSGDEKFSDLGGLDALKSFCLRAMRRQGSRDALHRPRGVLLLSPPGCGKSQFCKALGNETGRPTLTLDVGALMGSLVGQTEQRTREALRIADAMAPCVLMVDEIEKALSGAASSGQTDSGVSARMFGSLLTWLNDHTSDVFFVATCNDISKLPPEFSRAERFDGVFFVDLPTQAQRQTIWEIYIGMFGLDPGQSRPADDNFTGAEVRACCRLAALLDVPLVAAAQNVVPVAITAAEAVERLRRWAGGRCLSADVAGIYDPGATGATHRRKFSADPSSN